MLKIIELQDESIDLNIQYLVHDDKDEYGQQTVTMTVDSKLFREEYNIPWNLDEPSEDTVETLLIFDRVFKRTLRFYEHKYFTYTEVTAMLTIAEYDLDLFGAETYNGWDYDGLAEDLDITYEEAVVHELLYCVGKMQLELFLRESE